MAAGHSPETNRFNTAARRGLRARTSLTAGGIGASALDQQTPRTLLRSSCTVTAASQPGTGEGRWSSDRLSRRRSTAALRAGPPVDGGARPYDLRHSFASLLLYEGRVGVAAQPDHDPQHL